MPYILAKINSVLKSVLVEFYIWGDQESETGQPQGHHPPLPLSPGCCVPNILWARIWMVAINSLMCPSYILLYFLCIALTHSF